MPFAGSSPLKGEPPATASMGPRRNQRGSFTDLLWRRKGRKQQESSGDTTLSAGTIGGSTNSALSSSVASTSTFEEPQRTRLSAFLSPRPVEDEGLDPLLTQSYPDPDAVRAFAEALEEDQGTQEPPHPHAPTASSAWTKLGLPSLRSPPPAQPSTDAQNLSPSEHHAKPTQSIPVQTQPGGSRKVGKIAAVSDFAPVRERTTKDTGRREGFVYAVLRWPLLLVLFLAIGLEFFAYVLTRQIVNVVEWLVAHRGRKGALRRKMRKARTFDEWTERALELDEFMDHEKWKRQDASGMYDWILIKKVLHSLKTFREQGDDVELMAVLDLCCRNNFAGTENFRLYSETYYGTKYLIEEYLSEVERGFERIMASESISLEQKRTFFRGVSKNLGRSGLCLSGGGAFGYYHIGLVKALLDAKLLPKIVSGTSAGGLIAALTCTRTDEELSKLLVPELADRITACEEPIRVWAKRAWQTGARFDPVQWADKASFFTMGSLTFKEAFERTGKTLNVSVIPSDRNSPVKLLNYLTAPRCVIWSALLASAAVPGLLPPVCLMQKTRKGDFVPWNWGHRFKDGSLRVDIPLQDLHSMFHVNYPIVSQVNPHVHLFFFAPTGNPGRPVAHRKGKGWRGGFLLSAAEHVLKLHLSVNFKIIRDLDLLPAILGTDWSGVFLQRFGGAVTIWPKTRFWDWIRILSDPDRAELTRMLKVGQQATWPKLHMIENRIRMERAVEHGRKMCRVQLKRAQLAKAGQDPSQRGTDMSRMSSADYGAQGGPHQDSGTDASAGAAGASFGNGGAGGATTPGAISDTDAEVPTDYFRQRPGSTRAHNRRLFGGFSGMMTPGTDGVPTPGSAAATPGELPLHSRMRSSQMDDDDEDVEDDAVASDDIDSRAAGVPSEGFSQRVAQGDRASSRFAEERLDAHLSVESSNGSAAPSRRPSQALTAAALSPTPRRGHNRQRRRSHQPSHADAFHSSQHGTAGSVNNGQRRHDGDGGGAGAGHRPLRSNSEDTHGHGHYKQPHLRDWSGGRGSIGPTSPWDDRDDGEGYGREEDDGSDSSSSASDAR